jgi:thioester reductase-like protein
VRTVLVTGATGAIGSLLTKYLLDEEDTRVRLLVRARSAVHLDARVREMCSFWGVDVADPRTSARLEAQVGDVTLPMLGLSATTHGRLAREVTHIIHSAGNVKLNRPLDEARRSAVDSTRYVVEMADACRAHGQFQKLDAVSTVGVAGRMPGTVPERALSEPRGFRNSYEAAKAEAEQFLLEQMGKGLPATIHRPSMVVGDSHDGRTIQFQVFYHLCEFLSGKRTAGLIPETGDSRLDIIPVDYVARAIQMSSASDDATGRIFHLCSGPARASRIDDLSDRVQRIFASNGQRLRPLRRVPLGVVRALVPMATWLTRGRVRNALQSLPYFLAYLEESQTFGNTETGEFFSRFGLTSPAVDSYLDPVLSYYLTRQGARRG